MLYMLHKMSELRGWTHDEMLSMSKSVFLRYYGYWYMDQINQERQQKWDERKRELEAKSQQNRNKLGINY